MTIVPAGVSEPVQVEAEAAPFVRTIQAATNFTAPLLRELPTARTMLSAVDLAPSVHATGPDGALSIAGAMSFESLFMVNGVQIQDNLRGTPFNLFIEDAIQETTVVDVRHLRGVRPVHRRRRQHDHQVGRQSRSAARSGRRSPTTTGAR